MPITRPCASASGPLEFPGASLTDARQRVDGVHPALAARQGVHDAGRERSDEAEWVADRDHQLTDAESARIAGSGCGEPGGVDFQRRQIAARIAIQNCRVVGAAVP